MPRAEAADVQARLHNVGLGGRAVAVEVEPPLPRSEVRRARTAKRVAGAAAVPASRAPAPDSTTRRAGR